MSRVYDNWERLVEAALDRERLRQLALSQSFSSCTSSDFSSRFSFDLPDVNASGIFSKMDDPGAPASSGIPSYHAVQPMNFEELKKATGNFRPDRGFGHVYKGWIHENTLTAANLGSGMAVAVKRWKQDSFQAHSEWLAEINYLSKLRHPNLVRLIGYCSEGDNLLLVHEFLPKGSLANHLFARGHQFLSWNTRIKVAIGAATGLSFLHNTEKQVILRDFKASHILLDSEFNAKLSDFSLAKDGPDGDMTHVSTQVMGTYGYAAPEYIATGHLTAKCDVYAFGVLLLELLSGRRVIDLTKESKEQNLVEWAKPFLHRKRMLFRIMDTKLEGQYPRDGAYAVGTLAFQCLSQDPKQRPRMAKVLVSLEKVSHQSVIN